MCIIMLPRHLCVADVETVACSTRHGWADGHMHRYMTTVNDLASGHISKNKHKAWQMYKCFLLTLTNELTNIYIFFHSKHLRETCFTWTKSILETGALIDWFTELKGDGACGLVVKCSPSIWETWVWFPDGSNFLLAHQ